MKSLQMILFFIPLGTCSHRLPIFLFVSGFKNKEQGNTFGHDYHLVSYFSLVPSLPIRPKKKVVKKKQAKESKR